MSLIRSYRSSHARLVCPSFMLYAVTQPRTPNSPPEMPTNDLVLVRPTARRSGLAVAGFAVHHRPDYLRRSLASSATRVVSALVHENLAVGIGDAAVDGVAAHDRDHVRILPRFVFPDDLAVMSSDRARRPCWGTARSRTSRRQSPAGRLHDRAEHRSRTSRRPAVS